MREKRTVATRKDFKVETMRGSGPGGQKRNKTDSCVRITHIPTGLSEFCCDTPSQHKNRTSAFKKLAPRVVEAMFPKHKVARNAAGNEVIRSYNEPGDRVVDTVAGRFSYKQTVGRGDMGLIIDSRAETLLLEGCEAEIQDEAEKDTRPDDTRHITGKRLRYKDLAA